MKTQDNIISRRNFLKTAGVLTAASTLPSWFIEECNAQRRRPEAESLPPSERLNLALIGCGGQGRGVANWARNFGRVVAVCDVDQRQLDLRLRQLAVLRGRHRPPQE